MSWSRQCPAGCQSFLHCPDEETESQRCLLPPVSAGWVCLDLSLTSVFPPGKQCVMGTGQLMETACFPSLSPKEQQEETGLRTPLRCIICLGPSCFKQGTPHQGDSCPPGTLFWSLGVPGGLAGTPSSVPWPHPTLCPRIPAARSGALSVSSAKSPFPPRP